MVQPPPPVQNGATEPATTTSLVDTIHSLHNLILGIALPKTDKAKTIAIAIVHFQLACSLITSACASLQAHHENLQLVMTSVKNWMLSQPILMSLAWPNHPSPAPTLLSSLLASNLWSNPKHTPGFILTSRLHRPITPAQSLLTFLMMICPRRSMGR